MIEYRYAPSPPLSYPQIPQLLSATSRYAVSHLDSLGRRNSGFRFVTSCRVGFCLGRADRSPCRSRVALGSRAASYSTKFALADLANNNAIGSQCQKYWRTMMRGGCDGYGDYVGLRWAATITWWPYHALELGKW